MSYLEQLLRSLTTEEIIRLQSIKAPPAEKRFLKELLQAIEGDASISELDILPCSDQYLYKLRSVLLSKILSHLAGDRDDNILRFLQKKNLYELLLRFAKIADQRTGSKLQGTPKELFYRILFHATLPLYEHSFDEERLALYAKKYAEARVVPLPDEELFLEANLIYCRAVAGKFSRNREEFIYELNDLKNRLTGSPHIEAYYMVLRTLVMLYRSSKNNDLPKAAALMREVRDIAKSQPFYFTTGSVWYNELVGAELELLQGNVEEAYQSYYRLFYGQTIFKYWENHYHYIRFFLCHLYTGRLQAAAAMLAPGSSASDWFRELPRCDRFLCSIPFHLLNGDTDAAREDTTQFFQHVGDESVSLEDEFYVRAFETCAVIAQGDYQYAESLIKRHQKFGEYHSDVLRHSVLHSFFRLLYSIIEELRGVQPLRASQNKKIETFRTGAESNLIYCLYLLLRRLRTSDQTTDGSLPTTIKVAAV